MKFLISTRVQAPNQPSVTSTIYDGCCLRPYQVLYSTLKTFGGQQPDSWQRVNKVPTQNSNLYSRNMITRTHINKCMIYIDIIILLDNNQYYYEPLTTLLNTIFTVTIIYSNIASSMSKEEEYEEYGDKRNSQPEEDIEIKEEKELRK